jgi:hypothetical protein
MVNIVLSAIRTSSWPVSNRTKVVSKLLTRFTEHSYEKTKVMCDTCISYHHCYIIMIFALSLHYFPLFR